MKVLLSTFIHLCLLFEEFHVRFGTDYKLYYKPLCNKFSFQQTFKAKMLLSFLILEVLEGLDL